MPARADGSIDFARMNSSELRLAILTGTGIRISRSVPHEDLVSLMEESTDLHGISLGSEEHDDPLMDIRRRFEDYLDQNRENFSNQLRCDGLCTTGPCTDAQVMACYLSNIRVLA